MASDNLTEVRPADALVIVDVQNDFCGGGALAVPEGDEVVLALNRVIPFFAHVITTQDWHPREHCSFQTNGGPWPVHCLQDSPGARLHADLSIGGVAIQVLKGSDPEREAYSGFEGEPKLDLWLRDRGIERVFIGGLATDFCVRATALDAVHQGFDVVLIGDACRGVEAEGTEHALREMEEAGVTITESSRVISIAGRDA